MIASPCFFMDVRIGSLHDSAQMGVRRGKGLIFIWLENILLLWCPKRKVFTRLEVYGAMHMVQGWK